ncbi:MAG: hypothetical protein J0647_04880 [Campylobacteraceae bacterium]|nr:hypothetical protein [Campylobacteraceae bacterium]
MKVSLATEMAPPFALVAHFFIAGVVFLFLSSISLLFLSGEISSYFVSPLFAAFAHLYLLGFVMMIIFGAMYQLLPVVLEAPIFSKDFAYVQFYMYIVGFLMMISGFLFSSLHLLIPYGATITYLSMVIFCVNIFLTFLRLEQINFVGKFLLVATIFLFTSVTIGLIMGFVMGHGSFEIDLMAWVKAHMIGTLGGFVMMVVMGVAMVLIPMFSLAHGFSDKWIKVAFYVQSTGVSLSIFSFLGGFSTLISTFSLFLIALSLFAFAIQIAVMLKSRARKQNDYWVKNIVFAVSSLLISIGLILIGFIYDLQNFALAGGFLFFFGFLLCFIVGHIYKILPFLIWYDKFAPLVGKQKVPLLHQMIKTKVADFQTLSLFMAIIIQVLGILFSIQNLFFTGALIMLLSNVLVVYNTWYTFNYTIKE